MTFNMEERKSHTALIASWALATLFDLITIAAFAAAAAIGCGWAGIYHLRRWTISATTTRYPLTIAAVVLVIRFAATNTPLVGLVALDTLRLRALATWRRVHDAALRSPLQDALLIVYGVMLGSLALKWTLAYRHPGFWTGDDVESIHTEINEYG